MKGKIKYTDEPIGKVKVISDFLPSPKELALKDEYFVERRLYPDVDFYSGVIYNAIGTPVNMFTALFAIGRLPGWIAQWHELHHDKQKIGRPRQVYVGPNERQYPEIDQR